MNEGSLGIRKWSVWSWHGHDHGMVLGGHGMVTQLGEHFLSGHQGSH